MPIENCAILVDCCIEKIYAPSDSALGDPALVDALKDLLFALRDSLVHNQPDLTATLLHNHLRDAKDPKAQTMRSAAFQELKEIR